MINSLCDYLDRNVDDYPHEIALTFDSSTWTWFELNEQVTACTHLLMSKGVLPRQHVALWLQNTPAFIISFLAILKCNAIAAPLNPALKAGDLANYQIPFDLIVTSEKLKVNSQKAFSKNQLNQKLTYLTLDDEPRLIVDKSTSNLYKLSKYDVSLLMFSSGSTGLPKALYRSHSQCIAEIEQFNEHCNLTSKDRFFCAIPLFHAHALGNALFASLGSGGALVLLKNPQPFSLQWLRALRLLEASQATIFPAVPMMFDTLAKMVKTTKSTANIANLRLCFSAGSALSSEIKDNFFETFSLPVRQLYGCTEAGAVCLDINTPVSNGVGIPLPDVEISIRGVDQQVLAMGSTGEIWLKSKATTQGYLNLPQVNQHAFIDGWFLTGDHGVLNGNGQLSIVGRKQHLVEISGHKVYLTEVEQVLLKHPNILEVAISSVTTASNEQALKAHIVLSTSTEEAEIIKFCRLNLPQFKRPHVLSFLKSLPRTPLNKLDRSRLI